MRHLIQTTAAALAILSGAAAHGQVLYSNFGTGDSYSSSTRYSIGGGTREAIRFAPTSSGTMTRVEAGMGISGTSTVTLSLVPDVGGGPGSTVLWSASNATVSGRAIYTFDGPSLAISSSQTYWLVANGTAPTSWWVTSPAVGGTAASDTGGGWGTIGVGAIGAFRISSNFSGACCSARTGMCMDMVQSTCTGMGLDAKGVGTSCSPTPCHACPGDFNHSGAANVQDIFDFLTAWFAGC